MEMLEIKNDSDMTIMVNPLLSALDHGFRQLKPGEKARIPYEKHRPKKRILYKEEPVTANQAYREGILSGGDIIKEAVYQKHAGIPPGQNAPTLVMGGVVARVDVTKNGCSPSTVTLRRLREPVEKYGRTNRFVLEKNMATGFRHVLLAEKPEWAVEKRARRRS
jgi:hypothetical protein